MSCSLITTMRIQSSSSDGMIECVREEQEEEDGVPRGKRRIQCRGQKKNNQTAQLVFFDVLMSFLFITSAS